MTVDGARPIEAGDRALGPPAEASQVLEHWTDPEGQEVDGPTPGGLVEMTFYNDADEIVFTMNATVSGGE